MDILTIEAVTDELSRRLARARINKIHQPAPTEIVLRLWTGRCEERLLISTAPQAPRLHLSTEDFTNPFTPPRFCQLLRARLRRLLQVEQITSERIVHLRFSGPEAETYTLAVELLGRSANLVLVAGDGRIVDGLRRIEGKGKRRSQLPGEPYELPPRRELVALAEGAPRIPAELSSEELSGWLFRHLTPMSSFVARDIVAAAASGISSQTALERFRQDWLARRFRPVTGFLDGEAFISPFALQALQLDEQSDHESPSAAAERFYALRGSTSRDLRAELHQCVNRERRRVERRLENIAREQENRADSEELRRWGDLLLANLHRLEKGMAEAEVEDWYQDPLRTIRIPLDKTLTPQENAQRYFRGYRKTERGAGHIERRLRESRDALAWIEGVELALEEAEAAEDLFALRTELEDAGIWQGRSEPGRRKKGPDMRSRLRSTVTPGGFRLYWGRSNLTNDYVSQEMARPQDLWFHACNMPGSHLVLRRETPAQEVSDEDRLFAAALAAGYSKGRQAAKVEVMMSEGRHVRKPKGASPGLVSVENYTTLMVQPLRLPEEDSERTG